MKRRDFLRNMAAIGSGAALAKTAPSLLFGEGVNATNLHLSLLTDQPATAIVELESLVQRLNLTQQPLEFSEYRLTGRHMSDLLLVDGSQIIDYKNLNGVTPSLLQTAAKRLRLPRPVDNPTVFSIATKRPGAKAQHVNIYRGNTLVEKLALATELESHPLPGMRGEVVLNVSGGQASVSDATCKHQTCVKLGKISKPGQSLVCIPNQIRIAIAGENAFGIDTLAF